MTGEGLMGYVLPKGSSKRLTNYTGKPKKRRIGGEISVKLPEPVRIPPRTDIERSPKP
jgi:hypothetical protein